MHTIQIGRTTYEVNEPMAARLLSEAKELAVDGRTLVSRGLVSLAMKIEHGHLSSLGAEQIPERAQAAL